MKLGIIGSTGSIGTQTLDVVRELNSRPESPDNPHVEVLALAAGRNVTRLAEQAKEFSVKILCIDAPEDVPALRASLGDDSVRILVGSEGLCELASQPMDVLVTAVVGMRGLRPTLCAIQQGTTIALANKETLVAAGHLVMEAAQEKGVKILPVDSEHSAIRQCLDGGRNQDVEKLILTASGGPFRTWEPERLAQVSVEETLRHPTWKMGGKITVDCASMMNKGLEVIEAHWLFHLPGEQIDVVVHPQSIIHSMVQYRDGSIIAQMGPPDMRLPIQYALTYPVRGQANRERLSFPKLGTLTFEAPNKEKFPCLRLAYEALARGGTLPAVLNGANEVAVEAFLRGQIKFTQIPYSIEKVLESHRCIQDPDLATILEADREARRKTLEWIS